MWYNIETWLHLAGLAQICLVIGSLAIPKVLKWTVALAGVEVLIRQMFWTYAGYILVINLCFGLLSLFGSGMLTDDSKLAFWVTSFIFFLLDFQSNYPIFLLR